MATKASFNAVGTMVVAMSADRVAAAITASTAAAAVGLKEDIAAVICAEDWVIALIIDWVTAGDKVIVTDPDPREDFITAIVSELTPALANPSDNAVILVVEAWATTTILSAAEKLLFEMVNVTDSFPAKAIWVVPIWESAETVLVITLPDSVVVVVEAKVSPEEVVEREVTTSPLPPPVIAVVVWLGWLKLKTPLDVEEVVTIEEILFWTTSEVDVSIVIERAEEAEETFPAASVAVEVIEYIPSSRAEVSVMEKLPLLSAVVTPKTAAPFLRVTVEPASAVPDIVGVESFVLEILVKDVGAFGAVVSIVIDKAREVEETLPAASVAFAVIEYVPSEIGEDGVNEKLPSLSAVVVPKVEESINMVMVEFASALPVIVGVGSLVIEEEVAKEVGASGDVVSIVMESEEDLEEIFPAESVADNLTE